MSTASSNYSSYMCLSHVRVCEYKEVIQTELTKLALIVFCTKSAIGEDSGGSVKNRKWAPVIADTTPVAKLLQQAVCTAMLVGIVTAVPSSITLSTAITELM